MSISSSSSSSSSGVMVVVVVVVLMMMMMQGCDGASDSLNSMGLHVKASSRRSCHGPTTTTTINNNTSTSSDSSRFGVIVSPEREGEMTCSWVIVNPRQETLLLSFTHFNLEAGQCGLNYHKCCSQWLMLYTGDTPEGRPWGRKSKPHHPDTLLLHHFTLGSRGVGGGRGGVVGTRKLCGSELPTPIVTQAPRVYIKYFQLPWLPLPSPGSAHGHAGFRLLYYAMSNGSTCEPNEFTCSASQLCVPRSHLCDGQVDCPDGSDEKNCDVKVEEVEKSLCEDHPHHLSGEGVWKCPEREDMKGCAECDKDRWWCGVGQECYSAAQRCDGTLHCSNGMDELSCSPKCQHQVSCWGEGCYLLYQRCDGSPDCGDASDEANCTPALCNLQNGTFLCDNHRCIRETWRCDQLDDCRDGSDEQDCLRNSVIGVAAMGGLTCSLLLVMAVGCTGRLYALRMGLTRLQNSGRAEGGGGQPGGAGRGPPVPRSRLEEHLLQREMPPPYDVAVNDQSSPLFSSWACHRQWLRPSVSQERADTPPSTAPRVPVYGGAPPCDPHHTTSTTQGLTVEIQVGVEKVEDRDGEDVPLLSALVGGGDCHEGEGGRGREEDDVPLLLDLISTTSSSTSSSTCELDSDEDLVPGSSSVGVEGDEEAVTGMRSAAPPTPPSHHPALLHLTPPQHPTPHTYGLRSDGAVSPSCSSSSSSSSSLFEGGDVMSDTRAAVLALSAVQSHMDNLSNSNTEMMSQ